MRLTLLPRPAPAPPPDDGSDPTPPTSTWRRLLDVVRPRGLGEFLRHNRGRKAIAILVAFFLWWSINASERDAERQIELPVRIKNLPTTLVETSLEPKPVRVTLRGPRTILDTVDERKARFVVDLATATAGENRVDLSGDMVKGELPRRLKIVRMEPPRLRLKLENLTRRTLPVHPDLAGVPGFGYTVAESHLIPEQIEVSGPASRVNELKEITTEPIDLRGLQAGTVRRDPVPLSWAGEGVRLGTDHVAVTIRIEEVMVSREFQRVEVHAEHVADGLRAHLAPPAVDLTVRGPQRVLHNYKLPENAISVDAHGKPAGSFSLPVKVDLPTGLEVVRREPETIMLQLGAGKGN
jgi:YbbR domain-containing protein